MNPVNELIQRYWIIKDENRELYREVKRTIPAYKKFLTEQLGWKLLINERFIKLEKTPAYAHAYMGIQSFMSIRDYCLLCAVLMYLEDKEDREQFLLSEIVDVAGTILSDFMDVDWTQYEQRKSLIRVMHYCDEQKLVLVHEETDEGENGFKKEALYENTGLSRYFTTTFQKDLSTYTSYKDFENYSEQSVNEDRGHYRLNRIYRQLVASPAIYWQDAQNQDAQYLKAQRQWIQKNADEHALGILQVHKNAAFLVFDEAIGYGQRHPSDRMLSEVVLLVCTKLRHNIIKGVYHKQDDEVTIITRTQFTTLLQQCREDYQNVWTKEYRIMEHTKLENTVLSYMEDWMLATVVEDEIHILPGAGKIIGKYLHKQEEVSHE